MADTTARIVLTAEDKTAAAMASLRNGLSGIENRVGSLRGVFGALLPVASLAGATALFKQINDGVDALNDLKDASGASIANISALEDIAARTGTSMDVVGTSLVKFNQLLNAATPGSTQAAALKAIGLEAEALKKLDPAEALRQYAVALSGFADDGNKARLVQEQLGRSIQEVAPFLNDLAEKTELVGTVTDEQTAAAEKFNKQLFSLQKNAADAGRALTSSLLPALTETFEELKAGISSTDGFFDAITTLGTINPFFTAGENIKRYTAELEELTQARDRYTKAGFNTVAYDRDIADLQKKLAYLKEIQRNEALAGGAANQSAAESARLGMRGVKGTVVFDPDVEKRLEGQRKNAEESAKKMAEAVQKANDQIFKSTNAEMFASIDAFVEADFKATADLAKQLTDAAKEETRQYYEFKDQQREEDEQKERDAAGVTKDSLKELQTIAQDLGFTFSSAFEDAVVGGQEFSQVLQGIADDILRITLRRQVTEPLALAVGSLFGGGAGAVAASYAGYFANGGIMSAAGPLPLHAYASGGVASSPQLAIFGEGSMNEAYVPLPDGRRIPVNLNGGGSGSNVVVNVIEAPGQGGQQSTRQQGTTTIVDVMVDRVKSAVADDITRGSGAVSASMERTYGLNRAPGSY